MQKSHEESCVLKVGSHKFPWGTLCLAIIERQHFIRKWVFSLQSSHSSLPVTLFPVKSPGPSFWRWSLILTGIALTWKQFGLLGTPERHPIVLHIPLEDCLFFTKYSAFISPEIRLKGHSLQEALPNSPSPLSSLITYLLCHLPVVVWFCAQFWLCHPPLVDTLLWLQILYLLSKTCGVKYIVEFRTFQTLRKIIEVLGQHL